MKKTLLCGVATALAVLAAALFLPDIKRYLKISRM
ncbi:DUF6893 family small protein [Kitasatospora sp. NPDC050543]